MDQSMLDRSRNRRRTVAAPTRFLVALFVFVCAGTAAWAQDCRYLGETRQADLYECCETVCDSRTGRCSSICDEVPLFVGADDDAEFARLKWTAMMSLDPKLTSRVRIDKRGATSFAAEGGGGVQPVLVCCSGCEGSSCWNCSQEHDNDSDTCSVPGDVLMDCSTQDPESPHDYSGCSSPPVS